MCAFLNYSYLVIYDEILSDRYPRQKRSERGDRYPTTSLHGEALVSVWIRLHVFG
jgi:hypothetical protein